MEEIEQTLTKIETLTLEVAAVHAEHEAASKLAVDADAALLERVVAMIKPALPALASRVQISSRTTGLADADRERTTDAYADWRGVYVKLTEYAAGPERERLFPRANDGDYVGVDLFLDVDGRFYELEYAGRWSKYQSSTSGWEARVRPMALSEVADEYDGEEIAKALLGSLERTQQGALGKRAEQLRAKAARLQAVAALLAK